MRWWKSAAITVVAVLVATAMGHRSTTGADESVFVDGPLEPGEHESILYVWTRDGDGQDSDFLAVVDADPESETFGEIVATEPTGSAQNEAHHFGYTADANRIFGGGLFSNKLFIYDVESEPRNPELLRTVDLDPTGFSGPHTMYAVPGGVMLAMLGSVDGGGPAALVKVDDDGNFIEAYPSEGDEQAVEYMYDVGVKPQMNRMITSAWAQPKHVKKMGGAPPEHAGNQVVVWNWKEKTVRRVVELDKAPLEVRWMHGPDARGGFINCGYGNSVWYWEDEDGDGQIEFHRVVELPEGSSPADMRVSYDNRHLYVSLWGGGKVQQYGITDPMAPELVDEVELTQPNMLKLSPDSKRLYVTNSILSTMDGDIEFKAWLFHVGPDGMEREERFDPDFNAFETGPAGPHDMLLR